MGYELVHGMQNEIYNTSDNIFTRIRLVNSRDSL